jgi:phage tail P2-like protein
MTGDDDLAPANATDLERELARLSSRLDLIDPSVIETIWDAWRCPAVLLPWLAWALSVDHWDEGWSEITKRRSIADSPGYHRRKGTVGAVGTVLDLAGKPYDITEWFEQEPPGRRGTALIHIEAEMAEVPDILRRIRPLVMTSKPKSRAVFFGAGERALAPLTIGAGLLDETLTTISPYRYDGEDADGAMTLGIGLLDETLTTIGAAA